MRAEMGVSPGSNGADYLIELGSSFGQGVASAAAAKSIRFGDDAERLQARESVGEGGGATTAHFPADGVETFGASEQRANDVQNPTVLQNLDADRCGTARVGSGFNHRRYASTLTAVSHRGT